MSKKLKRHGDHQVMSADIDGQEVGVVFMDHKHAEERIMRAMFRIRSDTRLLGIGTMSDRVRKYLPAMIPTCATDGRHMFYNPLFVESLTGAQLRFVMLHEIMHVAYSHHLRIREDMNMQVANIAMDYVINGIIMHTDAATEGFLKPPASMLYDDFFVGKDWSFETVYAYLIANQDKYPMVKQAMEGGQEGDDGDTCPQCGGSRGQSGDEDSDDSGGGGDGDDDQDGDEDGDSQGQGQGQCQCEGQEQTDSRRPSAMRGYNPAGEVWPAPPEVQKKAKEEHEEIQKKLSEGDFMEKSFGPTGGVDAICGEIRESDKEPIGWHHLKEYLAQVYSDERTWSRPNILRLSHGYYPSRERTVGTLHCVFDTSGSVSQAELEVYFANVEAICEQIGVNTLKLAYVDSQIRRPTGETWQTVEVGYGEDIEMMVTGRGGTQFDPIFHAIEEEQEDVHCLIYFTDGYGHCNVRPPEFHVVWGMSQSDGVQWWGEHGAWGETVQVLPKAF